MKVKAQMKADIKEMTDQFNKVTADMLEVQKSVDQIAAEGKRIQQAGEGKTFESELEKTLERCLTFAAYVAKKEIRCKRPNIKKGFDGLSIRTKAVPVSTADTEVVPGRLQAQPSAIDVSTGKTIRFEVVLVVLIKSRM